MTIIIALYVFVESVSAGTPHRHIIMCVNYHANSLCYVLCEYVDARPHHSL